MKRCTVLTLPAILCLFTLFGCSANESSAPMSTPAPSSEAYYGQKSLMMQDSSGYTAKANKTYDAEYGELYMEFQETAAALPDPLRKIVWTGEVSLETQNYEDDMEKLNLLVSECGGYIQSSSATGGGTLRSGERRMRGARLTLRIPSENFHLFMNGAAQIATLLSSSTDSNDITDSYFDTESRLGVLRVKEQRLLDMIARQGNLEELLKLENELSDTIYEIESLSGTLRKYDGLINYSTITLYLNEVTVENATIAGEGAIAKLSNSFGRSLSGLGSFFVSCFVLVIGNSPVIIFVLLLGFGVFMLIRVFSRKKTKKNNPALSSDNGSTEMNGK